MLIRIQDCLSQNDRDRLHFALGEDVPRTLRDDSSLGGTFRVLEALFEKSFISDDDVDYLTKLFTKINCPDAVKRLRGAFSFSFSFDNSNFVGEFEYYRSSTNA